MKYDTQNIFAKILKGDIPNETVYEDEALLVFKDIAPQAPVHLLVIPKKSYVSFDDFSRHESAEEIGNFFSKIRQVANDVGLGETGYRLVMNHGKDASQEVPHFHVHIIGGTHLGGIVCK